MLLFGLAIGRWWAIPLGAVGWMILVLVAVPISLDNLPLAAANTAIGVGARLATALALRGILRLTRLLRAA